MELAKPTEQHGLLQEHVGTWTVACTYYMDPSQPPMECTATETIESVGPFWTVSKFESQFMEMPFVGRATLGYDPVDEQFVGTWIDCMSPHIFQYAGQYDAGSKTLNMDGQGMFPHFGGKCAFRSTMEMLDNNEHRFEMFVSPPGAPEMKLFSYLYTRAN